MPDPELEAIVDRIDVTEGAKGFSAFDPLTYRSIVHPVRHVAQRGLALRVYKDRVMSSVSGSRDIEQSHDDDDFGPETDPMRPSLIWWYNLGQDYTVISAGTYGGGKAWHVNNGDGEPMCAYGMQPTEGWRLKSPLQVSKKELRICKKCHSLQRIGRQRNNLEAREKYKKGNSQS